MGNEKTIVWFGNHDSSHGRYGIVTLLDIADALIAVAKDIPLRLVVISNNRRIFEQLIVPLPIITEYIEWDPILIYKHIRQADLCVLPNSRDAFSFPKSASRAVLALSLGVPVVATGLPSLEPLEDCIIRDDLEAGIRTYLTDRPRVASDLRKARFVLEETYSGPAVARRWANLLESLLGSAVVASG